VGHRGPNNGESENEIWRTTEVRVDLEGGNSIREKM